MVCAVPSSVTAPLRTIRLTAERSGFGCTFRVYGGNGNKYISNFWQGNAQGDIEVKGNPNKYWSWVRMDYWYADTRVVLQ